MYIGIGPERGKRVEKGDALEYVLKRCSSGKEKEEFETEFGKDIVEWYFSGNWIEEDQDDNL